MNGIIIFVGSNTTGSGSAFAQAAARRGLTSFLLVAQPETHAWASEAGVRTIRTDPTNVAAVLAACDKVASSGRLVAITSTADRLVPVAARAARERGLPAPDPDRLMDAGDKLKQRIALAHASVPTPLWSIARDAATAATAFLAVGCCAVIKPLHGSGSVGTRLVVDADDAARYAQVLVDGTLTGRAESTFLVEEYIDGPQYSVELFAGVAVGVTRNHLGPAPCFVEIGHDFPAALDAWQRDAIVRTAIDAVNALDVGWGPAHVEIRVGSRGPVVIEVNARLAGAAIPELVRLAHGVDLVDATLAAWIGESPNLAPTHSCAASLRAVVAPHRSQVAAVDTTALPADARWVAARRSGDVVGGFGDFRDRVGYVLATGRDVEESAARASRWVEQVRVSLVADTQGGRP